MDVVGMFPLKKDTPAVSYREEEGGGIFKIDQMLLSVQQLTFCILHWTQIEEQKSGEAWERGCWKPTKCAGITTHYVCERNSENLSWKLAGYAPDMV